MSMHTVALFLHIIGAAGLFAGLGIEGIVYSNLKNASTVQQVLPWGSTLRIMRVVFAAAVLLLLLPGIYLVIESWGWNAWVITGLVLLISLSGYGSATGKKIGMTIGPLKGSEGSLTDEIKKRIADPYIMKSYKVKVTLAMGIIFIMTIKPDWVGSLISIVAAFTLGLLLDLPSKSKEAVKELESA
jgi:hypothetical protein